MVTLINTWKYIFCMRTLQALTLGLSLLTFGSYAQKNEQPHPEYALQFDVTKNRNDDKHYVTRYPTEAFFEEARKLCHESPAEEAWIIFPELDLQYEVGEDVLFYRDVRGFIYEDDTMYATSLQSGLRLNTDKIKELLTYHGKSTRKAAFVHIHPSEYQMDQILPDTVGYYPIETPITQEAPPGWTMYRIGMRGSAPSSIDLETMISYSGKFNDFSLEFHIIGENGRVAYGLTPKGQRKARKEKLNSSEIRWGMSIEEGIQGRNLQTKDFYSKFEDYSHGLGKQ